MQQIWLEVEASCVIAVVVGEIGQSTRRCHPERCEPMRKRCVWMCVIAERHTLIRGISSILPSFAQECCTVAVPIDKVMRFHVVATPC